MTKPHKRYSYDYPRPAVTVDLVVVTRRTPRRVLLIRRKHPPFEGRWALPGGFVDENEALEDAARRELQEETGLKTTRLEQLHTFGDPGRDPRGHTVSVVYLVSVAVDEVDPAAGDDAAEVAWFPLHRLPPLSFDHADILKLAKERMVKKTTKRRRSR
jgi:8-oxo-dGTP diphosphatase